MSQFRRSTYLLAAIIAVGFVGALLWNPPPPPKFVGVTAGDIPNQMGVFSLVAENTIADDTRAALNSATIFSRTYVGADKSPIDLTIIGGTDRSALHDPRACLVGAGWNLENDHLAQLPGTDIVAHLCRAVNDPDKFRETMLYVYVVDGKIVNQVTQIRMEMAVSALLGKKNRPVYFVRCMQMIPTGMTDDREIEENLKRFAAETWKNIGSKLSPIPIETAKN